MVSFPLIMWVYIHYVLVYIYIYMYMCKWRRRKWNPTPVFLPGESHGWRSLVGCSPWGREESDMTELLPLHFHALEKEMATHSSILAWRIPGMGEPGGLPSVGSHRVGHDWSNLAAATTYANDIKIFYLKNKSPGLTYKYFMDWYYIVLNCTSERLYQFVILF